MGHIAKYKVIQTTSIEDLEWQVTKWLEQGFELCGNLQVLCGNLQVIEISLEAPLEAPSPFWKSLRYIQVMILPKESTPGSAE